MGASILDRVVFPTDVKNGNPLSTRLHKLARFQVLKLGSSPNLYKLSHGNLLPQSRFSRNSFRRATLDLNSVLPSLSAPTPERFSYPGTAENRQSRILRKPRVNRR